MPHQLQPGETINIKVKANARYSDAIIVAPGQQYSISYNNQQRWYDLFIPASPAGYPNPLAAFFGMRVKGARCMALCAAYNSTDDQAFIINNEAITTTTTGTLAFFANDVPGFEWNNFGSIEIKLLRIA